MLISFNEKLAVPPTLEIGGKTFTMNYSDQTSESMGRAYYDRTLKIGDGENEITLDEGLVEFKVYGFEDAAGNTIDEALTEADVQNTDYIKVEYDETAPARVYSTVRLDEDKEKNPEIGEDKNKYYYVKNGDEFVFAMAFTEELKQPPTVTIAGRNVEMALNEKVKEEESKYLYEGKFTIPVDEEKLEEGKLEIKVSNIVDFAGNVMDDTIQTPTSNGRIVVYDRTAPGTGEDGFPLFILNYRLDDTRPYTVIKDGEKLFVEANFTEKLAHNPQISLIRKDGTKTDAIEIPYVDMIGERYRYYVVLPFDAADLQLENGDRIDFEITDVEDYAGNTTTFNNDNVTSMKLDDGREYGQVYYDNKAPEYYSLEILNITHYEENKNIENEEDKKDLKVATTGDRIRVLISFNEELAVEPQLRINGIECGTIPYSVPTSTSMERPYYLVDFTIAEETDINKHKIKLDEGKVQIEVYGYEDAAGNTISEPLTNDDIKNTNYTEVTYDVTPAQYTVLRLHNDTHLNNGGDLNVATNGDSLRFGIHFNEKLSVEPTLVIEGSGAEESRTFTMTFRQESSKTDYEYMADVKLTSEMGLPQGEVKFKIYGYEDAAGNSISEENALTEENINHNTYSGVEYDTIRPKFNNLTDGTIATSVDLGVTDDNFAYILITNNDTGYSWHEERYWTSFGLEGSFTVQAFDKAGNTSEEISFVIDITPPTPTITYSTEKLTNRDVTATLTVNEKVEIVGSEGWATEDNKTFTKIYKENTTDKFEIKDISGNTSDVTVTINWIDKEGPEITVDTTSKTIELEKGDSFEIPLASAVDNVDGTINDGNLKYDRIDWYGGNGTDENKVEEFSIDGVDTNREGRFVIWYVQYDEVGNRGETNIIVYVRDYSKVTLNEPTYETLNNGNVLVTINANKLIIAPSGWTISKDGKSISKEYSDNTDYLGEKVKVTGVNGGTKNVTIKIDSINTDTIYIGSEESLIQLAKDINNGTSFAGKTIKLTKNINLTGKKWTPIYAGNLNGKGSMLEGATIDGQGYAVKGLKSSRDAYVPDGSIDTPYGNGFISENAGALTIKNIKFYDTTIIDPTTDPANITGEYSQHYVGTVIGHNTGNITIENITVKNSHLENSWQCGGLVGYSSSDITFKNCSISNSFIGGPNATAGTIFGLGVVDITIDNCKSYNVKLYTDSLTWDTTAKKEGNFWVGHLYHNDYGKDTKLTVTNSNETDVTVVNSIEA